MQVPLMTVPELLGISRCAPLRTSCRDWAKACSVELFGPPAGFEEAFRCANKAEDSSWARRLSCMTMLHVLGAPDFKPVLVHVVEDHVHWLLVHALTKRWTGNMIHGSFQVSGAQACAQLVEALRPRCKLPHVLLDVIFPARSQVPVILQPLHCAILLSSTALVRMLLSVAKHRGTISHYTAADGSQQTSVSALLLAVLFADQDVVDILRGHGACSNSIDAMATMRLQTAFLWSELEERFINLNLDDEAQKLANQATELRRQAAEQAAAFNNAAPDA